MGSSPEALSSDFDPSYLTEPQDATRLELQRVIGALPPVESVTYVSSAKLERIYEPEDLTLRIKVRKQRQIVTATEQIDPGEAAFVTIDWRHLGKWTQTGSHSDATKAESEYSEALQHATRHAYAASILASIEMCAQSNDERKWMYGAFKAMEADDVFRVFSAEELLSTYQGQLNNYQDHYGEYNFNNGTIIWTYAQISGHDSIPTPNWSEVQEGWITVRTVEGVEYSYSREEDKESVMVVPNANEVLPLYPDDTASELEWEAYHLRAHSTNTDDLDLSLHAATDGDMQKLTEVIASAVASGIK